MADYVISCCSTADIPKEQFESRDLKCIYFHYQLNGVDHYDDLGQTISFEDFYRMMAEGADTATSQVNSEEYEEHFRKFLKEGKDIIHLCLSSGISGSINSANIARDSLSIEYPDRKIYIVDSFAASSGFGLLMDALCDLRDEGKSIDEVYDFAVNNRLRLNHWFFSTDLTFYVKGGRVSKTAGTIGGILGICPLLNVDYMGRLIVREKVRTKRKVISRIVEKMKECADNGTDYDGKCYISQSGCVEDAKAVAELVEQTFPKLKGKVQINYIGTTIGAHTGPGTVALFFWGKERVD
ncbi:MAG: DegV family protein [Lachnospiraceae bacterium]|nr:DegV family protein [Lachnospiraceae bacterium]